MTFRLHPVLLPFFLIIFLSGGFAFYAVVFLSLLIHEAGHIAAALLTGMRIRSCVILPYGGELHIPGRFLYPKKARVAVALGGPLATLLLLLFLYAVSLPGADMMISVQKAILLLNLLPVLPLDGGQAMQALLETESNRAALRTGFLIHSMTALLFAIVLLLFHLPATTLYLLLTLFLFIQNITEYRYRRYALVYEDLKRKRLTG